MSSSVSSKRELHRTESAVDDVARTIIPKVHVVEAGTVLQRQAAGHVQDVRRATIEAKLAGGAENRCRSAHSRIGQTVGDRGIVGPALRSERSPTVSASVTDVTRSRGVGADFNESPVADVVVFGVVVQDR